MTVEQRKTHRDMRVKLERWTNAPAKFYEQNYDLGSVKFHPVIEYVDKKEQLVWEHPPRSYSGISVSDPTLRRQEVDAHRLARRRAGYSRANQLAVARSVGTASRFVEGIGEPSVRYRASTVDRDCKGLQRIDDEFDAMPSTEFRVKSARAIAGELLTESFRNLQRSKTEADVTKTTLQEKRSVVKINQEYMTERKAIFDESKILQPLENLKTDLRGLTTKSVDFLEGTSKQTAIEIEQLNARVVEAETKLKTEVTRIKKKFQMTITELEMSLDVANKNNLELQKTIKKQSLQLTELQAHYDETQRQLAVTLDQYGIAQRRLQSMTSELEEVRANYEQALRSKRTVEQMYEEAQSRINELTTINVNLSAARSKLEQEISVLAGDYDEVTKELRSSDERYQRVQVELKHTVEMLHEEQERVIKIETIKKSLEIEVKNLSVRLEEVEANAIVGGKRIISKLEARMRDLELELEEEKRRHAETIKILRKKERHVKEVLIQCEEDQKNISLLQEALDKTTQKVNIYKRQLNEQEGMSQQSVTRVRRFQRELEAAEDRAESAENNLSLIRAKHRTFVTTSTVPGSQVYMVQETTRSSSETY